MKFYHFTSRFHVDACMNTGLFMGVIPLSIDPVKLKNGYQWITSNPDWDQSWNRQSTLPYDRTDCRLTIDIPAKHKKKVLKFDDDLKKMIPKEMYGVLAGDDLDGGDPENWYVFDGLIPTNWIKKVERKPADASK